MSTTFKEYNYENYTYFREELDLIKYDDYNTLLPIAWTNPSYSKTLAKSKGVLRVQEIMYND